MGKPELKPHFSNALSTSPQLLPLNINKEKTMLAWVVELSDNCFIVEVFLSLTDLNDTSTVNF